jgi:hypothetical protein
MPRGTPPRQSHPARTDEDDVDVEVLRDLAEGTRLQRREGGPGRCHRCGQQQDGGKQQGKAREPRSDDHRYLPEGDTRRG